MVLICKIVVTALGLSASAAVARVIPRNTIYFMSMDNVDRILSFTSHPECEDIADIHHKGGESFIMEIPYRWGGTVMAKKYDAVVPVNRVQAEIQWQRFEGKTYYDASAITNNTDNSGIRFVYPAGQGNVHSARSGCTVYPCDTAYLKDNDVQTKVTEQTDMVVEIGTKY